MHYFVGNYTKKNVVLYICRMLIVGPDIYVATKCFIYGNFLGHILLYFIRLNCLAVFAVMVSWT